MTNSLLINELTAAYNDKLADLELEKRLQDNYLEISSTVHKIYNLIDTGRLEQDELIDYMLLGYQYYRLLESYMHAMVKEDLNDSKL